MSDIPIPPGPWATPYIIGGGGGGAFSETKWVTNQSGLTVTKLQVWWDGDSLQAIQVTYSDQTQSRAYGQTKGDTAAITLAPGELVTALTLWGDGRGTRCGRIRMYTDKGQTFDHGKDTTGQTEFHVDLGSGLLVGMVGRSGNSIDCLALLFLNPRVDSVNIDSIQYQPDLQGPDGISSVVLQAQNFENPSTTEDKNWTISNSVQRTTSTTFTQTSAVQFGVNASVSVKAGLFEAVEATATVGFSWSKTDTVSTAATTSEAFTISWGYSGIQKPMTLVKARAKSLYGTGQTRYTSIVTVYLSDGSTSSFPENGVFKNVVYSQAKITSHTYPLKQDALVFREDHVTHQG